MTGGILLRIYRRGGSIATSQRWSNIIWSENYIHPKHSDGTHFFNLTVLNLKVQIFKR